MSETFDIAIVGAGIAGASLAAELAGHARVALLEAEDQPGYHTTGRSAAFWAETYGGPMIQPLTSASGPWLMEHGFLGARGGLTIARADQIVLLDRFEAAFADSGVHLERWGRARMEATVPGLQPDWVAAVYEPDSKDIDVGGVFGHYLGAARRGGIELLTRARLAGAERAGGQWLLALEDGRRLSCGLLINAAGAWADEVAQMAGLEPVGIQPLRRTMAQLRTRPAADSAMPLVLDAAATFYFKPESGRVWLTPHDETPSPPCDAAPEELDIAIAIDRFQGAVDWAVEAVERKWAGLRSFAPDRLPVYGFERDMPDFFWFAGQGGFGIQTAPAAARLAAQLILRHEADTLTAGLDSSLYAPSRFR